MINLRSADFNKPLITLPSDIAFIEVCDEEGNIACVISYDPITKSYNIFDSNSPKADRYKKLFKSKFIDKFVQL